MSGVYRFLSTVSWSVCLSVCLPLSPSPPSPPPITLSVSLSVYLSVCLSVCLSPSSLSLSLSLSLSPLFSHLSLISPFPSPLHPLSLCLCPSLIFDLLVLHPLPPPPPTPVSLSRLSVANVSHMTRFAELSPLRQPGEFNVLRKCVKLQRCPRCLLVCWLVA